MFRNIYSPNPGVHNNCHENSGISSQINALEKWQILRFHYRQQFELFKKMFGLILIIASTVLIVLNEKRAVQSSQSYREGLRLVNIITNPYEVLHENEGKLIHISGYLEIPELLEDYPYGVSIYAVKLKRRIQMFQWEEEKNTHVDAYGQPQVKYKKVWRDKLINSNNFAHSEKHVNPNFMPVRSEVRFNKNVRLGAFTIGNELKDKFNDFTQFTSGERPESTNLKLHMGLYYHCADIWNPNIGDLRIQFSFAGPADAYISVVAKQSGNTLVPFEMESGKNILYLHEGNKNHLEIFTKEHSTNIFHIWIFRISTWVLTLIGSLLVSKLFYLIKRRSQMMKNLLMLEPLKLSLVLTTFLSLMTVGCVWSHYRSFFGFLLITLSFCIMFYYIVIPPKHISSLIMHSRKKYKFTVPLQNGRVTQRPSE